MVLRKNSSFLILFFSTILVLTGCRNSGGSGNGGNGGGDNGGNSTKIYNLTPIRHESVELTDVRSKTIVEDMTRIIQTVDGPDDISTQISFTQLGNVGTFSEGDGIINSSTDFLSVNNLGGNVKIVNQINWCGSFSPSIIGCAPVPGNSMVVVRFSEYMEGILWLHEYGHNKGLDHRDFEFAVMNALIGPDRRRVNQTESLAYLGTPSASQSQSYPKQFKDYTAPQSLQSFLTTDYIHGFPYESATSFTAQDLPEIEAFMKDESQKHFWPNAIALMATIADDQSLDELIEWVLLDTEGELDHDYYRTKAAAIMSFGYFINRNDNPEAQEFLQACLNPSSWNDSQPNWKNTLHPDNLNRNVHLSTLAVIGMALSGSEMAEEVLGNLQSSQSDFRKAIDPTLAQAINDCAQIRAEGLERYYSN